MVTSEKKICWASFNIKIAYISTGYANSLTTAFLSCVFSYLWGITLFFGLLDEIANSFHSSCCTFLPKKFTYTVCLGVCATCKLIETVWRQDKTAYLPEHQTQRWVLLLQWTETPDHQDAASVPHWQRISVRRTDLYREHTKRNVVFRFAQTSSSAHSQPYSGSNPLLQWTNLHIGSLEWLQELNEAKHYNWCCQETSSHHSLLDLEQCKGSSCLEFTAWRAHPLLLK